MWAFCNRRFVGELSKVFACGDDDANAVVSGDLVVLDTLLTLGFILRFMLKLFIGDRSTLCGRNTSRGA